MLGRVRWELLRTSGRALLALLRSAVLSLVFARSKEEGIVFSEVWSEFAHFYNTKNIILTTCGQKAEK